MPATKTVEVINKRFGVDLDPKEIAQLKEDRFYRYFLDQIKPIQEVVEHLEESFRKGIKIGVVSGGRKRIVEETLKVLKIRDKVGTLICAEDVLFGKPHLEPFLLAAEKLKVEPCNCLVFEDAELGIQSAIAAKMQWVKVSF
jgi:HAD superfamily hydrolase (TIGR01509 family)